MSSKIPSKEFILVELVCVTQCPGMTTVITMLHVSCISSFVIRWKCQSRWALNQIHITWRIQLTCFIKAFDCVCNVRDKTIYREVVFLRRDTEGCDLTTLGAPNKRAALHKGTCLWKYFTLCFINSGFRQTVVTLDDIGPGNAFSTEVQTGQI